MTWQSQEAFLAGLDFFGGVVSQVPRDGWAQDSACKEWRVLDVLGHVGGVVEFGTALMNGERPQRGGTPEPPGGAVKGDPVEWWTSLVGPARTALAGADLQAVVDSPTGPRSIEQGLGFPAIDCFVHAWDMANPLNISVEIPAELIGFAHEIMEPIRDEQLRSAEVFAQPVNPPGDATQSERFIAWTGRNPRPLQGDSVWPK
jgi:uncharacterized protein (TIGR03086 family)